jgi:hypothetical protein
VPRAPSPRVSYPTIPRVAPALADPADRALARLATAKAIKELEEPERETPGDRLAGRVMEKVGEGIGELVARGIGAVAGAPSSPATPVDEHLKLTKDVRDQYGDLIHQLQERIEDLTAQLDQLKAERDGAYEAGFKQADERWQMRVELSDRTNARLDEIQAALHQNQLQAKDGQIAARDEQINRLIEELKATRVDLASAKAHQHELELERVRNEHKLAEQELQHKLEQAEARANAAQAPRSASPEEIVKEAWAKAEAKKLSQEADLSLEQRRQQIDDEHEESIARRKAIEGLAGVIDKVGDRAPSLIEAFVAGGAPSRGYGVSQRPSPGREMRVVTGGTQGG